MRSSDEIQLKRELPVGVKIALGLVLLGPPAGCGSLLLLVLTLFEPLSLLVTVPMLLALFQPGRSRVRRMIEYERGGFLPPAREVLRHEVNGIAVYDIEQPCSDGTSGARRRLAYMSAFALWAEVRIPDGATVPAELEPLAEELAAPLFYAGDGRWRARPDAPHARLQLADFAMCHGGTVDAVADRFVRSIRREQLNSPVRKRDVELSSKHLSFHPAVRRLASSMLALAKESERVVWAKMLGDAGVQQLADLVHDARSESVRHDAMRALVPRASTDAAHAAMWSWLARPTENYDVCLELGRKTVRDDDLEMLVGYGGGEDRPDGPRIVALRLAELVLRGAAPNEYAESVPFWRDVLVSGLRRASVSRLEATVDVLVLLGVRDVDEPITDLLSSPARAVRVAAANALARVGSITATPALRDRASRTSSRRYEEHLAIEEALAAIYDRDGTGEAGSLAIAEDQAGSLAVVEAFDGELTVVEENDA